MERLFFVMSLLFCIASSCFASPASKVCVAVYAMDGYDTPVEDTWYSDTYNLIAKELEANGVSSTNSKDVWKEFVYSTNRMGKISDRNEVKKSYDNFRKERFDHILMFKTDKLVTHPDTNTCDVEVTFTVKKANDMNGEPLLVYKDSAINQKASERDAILSSMVKDAINCYIHS